MSATNIADDLAPNELIGRRVSSSKNARRARRNLIAASVFEPGEGKSDISVDRISVAPISEITEIADRHDTGRGRTFYGWAIVSVESASANERSVVASPIPNINPYHADIKLPTNAADNEYQRKVRLQQHFQQLADASYWQAAEMSQ